MSKETFIQTPPATPYLRWREKHISFYECGADQKTMPEYRARFEKIRMEFAIQLGLRKRQVKCRLIGGVMSIYITKADFEKRRTDMLYMYRDKRDYSHFLYGLLVGSHNPRTR